MVRPSRRNGLTNTFEAADFLGVSALRNGTWVPAMANSLVHMDFQNAVNSLMHIDKAVQDISTSFCDADDKQCLAGLDGDQTCERPLRFSAFAQPSPLLLGSNTLSARWCLCG